MNWECAYCGHKQTAAKDNSGQREMALNVGETDKDEIAIGYIAIRCLNIDCKKLTLSIYTGQRGWYGNTAYVQTPYHHHWQMLPSSSAKPQPEYIPEPIRQDYYEACKIKNDSPKASATLARRCLQGMIRDFCGIVKPSLFKEITTLEAQLTDGTAPKGVDDETIAAITAIRKLGNIGAHMENDINVIVDVDPDEAQALIGLIEMLFTDWYVARHKRKLRLASIQEIAAAKEAQKNGLAIESSLESAK